jgi:beta-lactam-binding protein with PASTA domain
MVKVENRRLDKALKAIKKLDRKAKVTVVDNLRSRKVKNKKNWVVEVQDPAAGAARDPGSPVHLAVRKKSDPKLVAVPSLTGQTVGAAAHAAKRAGFKQNPLMDGPRGTAFTLTSTVAGQLEQPGSLVRSNTRLHVTLAVPEPPAPVEKQSAAVTAPAPAPAAAPVVKAPVAPKVTAPAPAPKATTAPAPTAAPTTTATKPATSGCHPSYVGECLPANASDVDCFGQGGNGPVYAMTKNIHVVGPDVYDLDRDGNGLGCE